MSPALEFLAGFAGLALLFYAGDLISAGRSLIADWIKVRRIQAENERTALRIAEQDKKDEQSQ